MSSSLRVLILEDEPQYADIMLHHLRRAGLEPDWLCIETEAEYIAALRKATVQDEGWDLILADCTLTGLNAQDALHLLQERELDIPFLIVSSTISQELAVEYMRQGAADYLIKDRLERLGPAAKRAIQEKRQRAETRRAAATLEQYAKRLQVLQQIDQAILKAQSTPEIAQAALHHLRGLVGCQRASVTVFDLAADKAVVLAMESEDEPGLLAGTVLPLDDSGIIKEMAAGRVTVVDDIEALSRPTWVQQKLQANGLRAYANLPLLAQGELIGSLNLAAKEPGSFDQERLQIAREVAGQLAIALLQARLFKAEQLARQAAESLRAANLALTQTLDLDTTMDTLLNCLAQVVPYDSANIMLLEEEEMVVAVRALRGYENWTEPEQTRAITFDARTTPGIHAVLTTPKSLLIPDTRQFPGWQRPRGAEHVINWLGVPLLASGQVIGLYSLDKTEPGFFTPEHVRLAELLAAQGAIAIQNASLHEQVQRHAAELEQRVAERTAELKQQHRRQSALASIELAINQPHELQAVLDRIVGITKTLLPASDASIILWNEQAQEFSTSASTVAGQKPQTTALGVRRLGGATRWIVDHGQPLTVSDVRDDPFSANPMLGKYGLRAYAGVPLPGDGESLGVLYALDRRLRQYSQKDLDFMAALAGRAALAITKVRLYQELQNSHRLLEQHAAELEIRNEDLDAFAHTVAHDLQNPVAIIIGFGEVLQDETLAEEARQSYLAQMADYGRRVSDIIDGLLLLAQVRKEEVPIDALDMAAVVDRALSRLASQVEEHQASIELPSTWPVALGYSLWVEEVWVNYLSNALKYGGRPPQVVLGFTLLDSETPTAQESLAPTPEQKSQVIRFWARDNGAGLTQEEQAHLFKPFTRLSQLRVQGHGLGLSVVRRIVEKLGGQVGVESAPGQGSLFYFTLPHPSQAD